MTQSELLSHRLQRFFVDVFGPDVPEQLPLVIPPSVATVDDLAAAGDVDVSPLGRVRARLSLDYEARVLAQAGELDDVPEAVVRPGNVEQLEAASQLGPNVAVVLDRFDRVLEIDPIAGIARVEPGASRASVEQQLQSSGWTLGDRKYGSLSGPRIAESWDRWNEHVAVPVCRVPPVAKTYPFLMPTFESAVAAAPELASATAGGFVRVLDGQMTNLVLASGSKGKGASKVLKGLRNSCSTFDSKSVCLGFARVSGLKRRVKAARMLLNEVVESHSGVSMKAAVGAYYDQLRTDGLVLRDAMLRLGVVSGWVILPVAPDEILKVRAAVVNRVSGQLRDWGVKHLLSTVVTVSGPESDLLVGFAFRGSGGDALAKLDVLKRAASQQSSYFSLQ